MADISNPSPETSATVGVSIDAASVAAVLLGADGSLSAIQLGSAGPATAAAVAQSPDGAVLVGDSALRSSGPIATDPIDRARKGRTGALTAVLAHVVGRAAALAGSTPRRLALVVPDDSTRDERDRFVESGAAAGITDVVLVPISAAQTMKPDVDPIVRMAAAAAMVANSGDRPPPIVTREDLSGPVAGRVVRRPAPSPQTPSGPRSVFDELSESAPAVATPRPNVAAGIESTAEPTREIPATVAVPLPPNPVSSRKRRPIGLLLALVALIIAGIGVAVIALVGGGSTTASPATTTTPPATVAPATTTPTTTIPAEPTSTSTTSTSTTSTTTSSTTTTTTSTTTVPVAVGVPGVVTLVETGLQLDTGTVLNFGQDDTSVIDSLTSALGSADLDSGWYDTAFCLGSRTRLLNWGDLEIVITEDVLDSAIGTFSQWFVDGIDNPVGLVTVDGLGYGASVGFLDATYGSALTIVEAIPDDPTGLFAVTNPASGGVLLGITTSLDVDGLVLSMWAGDSCTRIYT